MIAHYYLLMQKHPLTRHLCLYNGYHGHTFEINENDKMF